MAVLRSDLHELVEQIPEKEIPVARRFLQFLSQEPISPEFAESIRRGLIQAGAGKSVVCGNLDEMAEKLLDKV